MGVQNVNGLFRPHSCECFRQFVKEKHFLTAGCDILQWPCGCTLRFLDEAPPESIGMPRLLFAIYADQFMV